MSIIGDHLRDDSCRGMYGPTPEEERDALRKENEQLKEDMLEIANMLDDHPDVKRGNSTVHWVYHKARAWAMKGGLQCPAR